MAILLPTNIEKLGDHDVIVLITTTMTFHSDVPSRLCNNWRLPALSVSEKYLKEKNPSPHNSSLSINIDSNPDPY